MRRNFRVMSLAKIYNGDIDKSKSVDILPYERYILEHMFRDVDWALLLAWRDASAVMAQYRCEMCGYLSVPGLNIKCECEE